MEHKHCTLYLPPSGTSRATCARPVYMLLSFRMHVRTYNKGQFTAGGSAVFNSLSNSLLNELDKCQSIDTLNAEDPDHHKQPGSIPRHSPNLLHTQVNGV